ncbi:hypothetical protein D9M69_594190 [compost metagenome]
MHQTQQVHAPATRGQHLVHHGLAARSVQQRADAVAVARDEPGQHRHHIAQHLALALIARTEIDRGTEVQQKPGGHLAVFGEHANMRGLQAGGDVPVNVAHVVVVLVFAQVGQVQPAAPHEGAVVALQQTVEPADHGPLQTAQQGIRLLDRRCHGRRRLRGAGFEEAEQHAALPFKQHASRVPAAWLAASRRP